MLPGLLSWVMLAAVIVYSIAKPLTGSALVIAFLVYWVVRLVYMDALYWLMITRIYSERETNWMERAEGIGRLYQYWRELNYLPPDVVQRRKTSLFIHREELRNLEKSRDVPPAFEELYQLVIFTIEDQKRDIYEPGIVSILQGEFPAERVLIVLAATGHAANEVKLDIWNVQKKYKEGFLDVFSLVDPEQAGNKAESATAAVKLAAEYFKKKEIPFKNVIVTRFDSVISLGPEYFSCLSYHYLVSPDRARASFQALPAYHSRIWEAEGRRRVLEIGSSFFHMVEAANFQKRANVLGESMCLETLLNVDCWPGDLNCERTTVFWKSFLYHRSKFRIVPMYVKIYRTIPAKKAGIGALADCYRRRKRWAWDIENLSFFIRGLISREEIPFYKKITYPFMMLQSHVFMAVWPFIVGILAWLPGAFSEKEFSDIALYYTSPRIGKIIFILFMVILINSIVLSLSFIPRKRIRYGFLNMIVHFFEWLVFLPLSMFLAALAHLHVQTTLLFSKSRKPHPVRPSRSR
jgi:hypothetical protein